MLIIIENILTELFLFSSWKGPQVKSNLCNFKCIQGYWAFQFVLLRKQVLRKQTHLAPTHKFGQMNLLVQRLSAA